MSDRKKEQAVERALTEGYEKYYRLAYSYVHNEADALDIVQEAAYKAILKSDSLKEPQYVETWVYRIVINEACSFLRSRKESVDVEDIPFTATTAIIFPISKSSVSIEISISSGISILLFEIPIFSCIPGIAIPTANVLSPLSTIFPFVI